MAQPNNDFGIVFKTPVSLNQIINRGVSFVTSVGLDMSSEGPEVVDKWIDPELECNSELKKDVVSPLKESFENSKLQMEKLSDTMWKKLIKPGNLKKGVVPELAEVTVRYNAYLEKKTMPFDSTEMRGKNFTFTTFGSGVIGGLLDAVYTMCEGEQAWFILSYSVLYGEVGCPPRVPPKADALFVIDVINFKPIAEEDANCEVPVYDPTLFANARKEARIFFNDGMRFYKNKAYGDSLRNFNMARSHLKYSHLQNDEEEKDFKTLMIKLNLNMAICYNLLEKPKKVCIHINELRFLSKGRNLPFEHKLLYQEGCALFALGEFKKSRNLIKHALMLSPKNRAMIKFLTKIDEKEEACKDVERNLWRKAFQYKKTVDSVETPIEEKPKPSAELELTIQEQNSLNALEPDDEDETQTDNDMDMESSVQIAAEGTKDELEMAKAQAVPSKDLPNEESNADAEPDLKEEKIEESNADAEPDQIPDLKEMKIEESNVEPDPIPDVKERKIETDDESDEQEFYEYFDSFDHLKL